MAETKRRNPKNVKAERTVHLAKDAAVVVAAGPRARRPWR